MTDIKNYEFYYNLRVLPFVKELWLFGSRAKGVALERSDIDLAVLCPSASVKDWQKICDIIDDAKTFLKIDCVRFDQLTDTRLREEIEQSKVILFKRIDNNHEWYNIFLDLGEALEKFHKVLSLDKKQYVFSVEASIQVFEYVYELFWKLLKKICYEEGAEANSPRTTFKEAYAMKLIDDEQTWLSIMESRNLTSHTYKPAAANEIYRNLKIYLPVMQQTYDKIKAKYKV